MFVRLSTRRLLVALMLVVALGAGVLVPAEPVSASGRPLSPSINQCERLRPTLARGGSGQAGCVTALQGFLRWANKNYGIGIDGRFGAQTEAHVKWYQASRGLRADGIVGTKTWDTIRWECAYRPVDIDGLGVCTSRWVM